MNENIERTKKLLKEYMSDIVKEPFEVNVVRSLLGSRHPFRTNVSRQRTLDEYLEDVEGKPSFLVFDVLINPRFFIGWTPERMAVEIRENLVNKI